jgi:hypothetical protein
MDGTLDGGGPSLLLSGQEEETSTNDCQHGQVQNQLHRVRSFIDEMRISLRAADRNGRGYSGELKGSPESRHVDPPSEAKPLELPLQSLKAARDLFSIGAGIEGGDSEETLAHFSKAAPGRYDNVRFVEDFVERLPAIGARRGLDPNVRSVDAPIKIQARGFRPLAQHLGVPHVMLNKTFDLLFASRTVKRLGRPLHRVTDAVELGGGAPKPERMQAGESAVPSGSHEGFWDHRKGATQSREAAVF